MTGALCLELQASSNVRNFKIWKIFQYLLSGQVCSKHLQHVGHAYAHTTNARLPSAHGGVAGPQSAHIKTMHARLMKKIAVLDAESARMLENIASCITKDNQAMQDIRWKQRFDNYLRALQTLHRAVTLSEVRKLSELEEQGLIQGFEFTHELAWNVLKDYLEEQGFVSIIGSKNATRGAFKNGLITDGEAWMDMIKARNLTSHTYNTEIAQSIVKNILERFYPAFASMAKKFTQLRGQQDIDA